MSTSKLLIQQNGVLLDILIFLFNKNVISPVLFTLFYTRIYKGLCLLWLINSTDNSEPQN